jgi:hypothetical protein
VRVVGSIAVAIALAGCIAMPPEPSGPLVSQPLPSRPSPSASGGGPDPTPGVGPSATARGPVEATPTPVATPGPIGNVACGLRTKPGPDDAAPTEGDLTDWSHVFGGRMRICIDGAPLIEVEARTFCTWVDQFDAVREIAMVPVRVNAEIGQVDGGLSVERSVTYLGLVRPGGEIGSWEGSPADQRIRTTNRGKTGAARFNVAPVIDPEHPPAVVPPNATGIMRWECLKPDRT